MSSQDIALVIKTFDVKCFSASLMRSSGSSYFRLNTSDCSLPHHSSMQYNCSFLPRHIKVLNCCFPPSLFDAIQLLLPRLYVLHNNVLVQALVFFCWQISVFPFCREATSQLEEQKEGTRYRDTHAFQIQQQQQNCL